MKSLELSVYFWIFGLVHHDKSRHKNNEKAKDRKKAIKDEGIKDIALKTSHLQHQTNFHRN